VEASEIINSQKFTPARYLLWDVSLRYANLGGHAKQVVNAVVAATSGTSLLALTRVGGPHHVRRVTRLQHPLNVQVIPRPENDKGLSHRKVYSKLKKRGRRKRSIGGFLCHILPGNE
jgi:hypothetical protein